MSVPSDIESADIFRRMFIRPTEGRQKDTTQVNLAGPPEGHRPEPCSRRHETDRETRAYDIPREALYDTQQRMCQSRYDLTPPL